MNKPRILIVDDEPSFIRLLKLVLERTGRYSVRKEGDATKALEVALEFQPDLILLDFVMPKVDQVEAPPKPYGLILDSARLRLCFSLPRWSRTTDTRRRSLDFPHSQSPSASIN